MIEEELTKYSSNITEQSIHKWVYPIIQKYKAIPIPQFNNFNSIFFTFKPSIENYPNSQVNAYVAKWNSSISINLHMPAKFNHSHTLQLDYCTILDTISLFNIKELFTATKFYYNDQKKQLVAQQTIPIYNLIQQPNYVLSFCRIFQKITHKLQKLYTNISNQYLSAVELNNKKFSEGKKNYIKIIKGLKDFYEKQRIKRQKSTKCVDLCGSSLKWVDLALQIQQNYGRIKDFRIQKEQNYHNGNIAEKCFTTIMIAYEEKKRQQKINQKDKIIKSIQIQQEKELQTMETNGAFGLLQKFELSYYLKQSAHKGTVKHIQTYKDDEVLIKDQQLVKKDIVVSKKALDSQEQVFLTQKAILLGLRNQYSEKIAQYYFEISEEPHFNEKIYSKCYPKVLDFSKIKSKFWFKIVNDIIRGVQFLQSCSIVHRDLKPSNILINENYQSKIIDFGSSCPVFKSPKETKYIDLTLKSTRNYFRPYCTLPHSLTMKFSKQEFEQNINFDIFSFGSIMQKALSSPSGFDPFMADTMKYIMKKCFETNPDDRLCAIEIIVLLQYLLEYKKKE